MASSTNSAPQVTIYTTPSCPYCAKTRQFLAEHKIAYKDVNVESDPAAAAALIEKSGQMGVPVIEIGSIVIVGFDKAAMQKALGLG